MLVKSWPSHLHYLAIAVLLLALSPAGVASAAGHDAIVIDFSDATDELLLEAIEDLDRQLRQLADCLDEAETCFDRARGSELAGCWREMSRCVENEAQDIREIRSDLRRDLAALLRDALRDARQGGMEDEFADDPIVLEQLAASARVLAQLSGACE